MIWITCHCWCCFAFVVSQCGCSLYVCVCVCLNSVQCSILDNRVVQHMGVIVMLINEPVPRYIPCTFTWQEWSPYVLCFYFCVRDLFLQICHYYYPAPLYWSILQIISQTSSLPAVPLCACVCVCVCVRMQNNTHLWVYSTQIWILTQRLDPCVILMHTYFQSDWDSRWWFSASTKPDWQGSEDKILIA